MRFDVSSTALLSRLQSISKVIASKNSLPILDSFLFNLEGTKLTMTASDSETRLVTSVDVMNAEGSGVVFSAYRPKKLVGMICGHFRSASDRANGAHSGLSYIYRAANMLDFILST